MVLMGVCQTKRINRRRLKWEASGCTRFKIRLIFILAERAAIDKHVRVAASDARRASPDAPRAAVDDDGKRGCRPRERKRQDTQSCRHPRAPHFSLESHTPILYTIPHPPATRRTVSGG